MSSELEDDLHEIGKNIAATREKIDRLRQQPVPQNKLKVLEAELKKLTERYYCLNPKSRF